MVSLFRMSYKTVGLWGLVVGSSLASPSLWAAESSHYAPVGKGKSDAQHPSSKVAKANLKQQHPPQETIIVKARRRERMEVQLGGQAGVLGTKKGLDLPFNLRSYTSSMILNQQSQTLGQVLENDPSVRTTYGYGNFSEVFIIRGLPIYGDDVAINGLYGITPRQLVSPQLYDSVQVMNGANAFLNGAAPGGTSIGGNINLQFKHAGKDPLLRVTGDYTGTGQGGGNVDMSRRFGESQQFGVRFNAAGMDGQTSIHGERRHSVALGLDTDWHNEAETTRITMDINYQNQNVQQGRGGVLLSSALTSVPKPTAPSHNWGQRWSYEDMHYVFGMVNVEHDLNKHITLYGAFGGLTGKEEGNYSSLTVTNAQTGAGTDGFLYVPYQETNESTRGGARVHVNTGPLKHEINLGASSLWNEVARAWGFGKSSASNLYAPIYSPLPETTLTGGNVHHPKRDMMTRLYSVFFSDTVSFWHDRIALTGGFRYQNIMTKSYGYKQVLTDHYDRDAITPVVGLVIHMTKHSSFYFNRVEGLAPGPQATGANIVNMGQLFAPVRTVQYEFGGKYDIGRFSASLAFYRLTQPNSYVRPYGNTGQGIFTVDGEQRNQGIEFNINGEIIKGLRFNGGTALIDAKQMKGTYEGQRAIGVPGYTINGNIEYDIPFAKGLTLTGRVIHTGHQWANAQNTQRIANWTTYDLGGRYTFLMTRKQPMTLRFGVENLTNSHYWASSYGGYLTEGLPRTFKASLTMDL
ncbi:TonB-dependent receptor [Bombella saccharophila]|uniref:TonB-dependent receptor n=1 Tax=Bombella saccharophila TaxID=2967338 RepID=A0ABT3W5G2_9PROT|nr:TonB-dependent receptor [Bombella saccharophila]MCX5613938.1 TonB-dependent receptor [Bombella saccharophila]